MQNEQAGNLYIVATPIGNLQDISLRAKETLAKVAWIAAEDTRHSAKLLSELGIKNKLISYHQHNEHQLTEKLITKLRAGKSGAIISDAGTPLIRDPGLLMVRAARTANIPVVPIPGACAAVAAISCAGLPAEKYWFEGFLPAASKARRERLEALKQICGSIIIYESVHRLTETLIDSCAIFGEDHPAFIARELTKKFEQTKLSSLQDLLINLQNGKIPLKGEFVLVIQGASDAKIDDPDSLNATDDILKVLMAELPLKQAATLTAKISGHSKNALYQRALQLKQHA